MSYKAGIIGPTNMGKLSRLTGKTEEFFITRGELIGETLARQDCEVWVNSDMGMTYIVGQAYKQHGGKKLVVLYPEAAEPWPNKHAKPQIEFADEVSMQKNWFWANYAVTALPEVCICTGLSAGTLSELAYIKWNCQFQQGNLKKLYVIKELVRDERLPPEIEAEIGSVLEYIDTAEGLEKSLQEFASSAPLS